MAATVNLVLRTDKKKADGTCPVWLRFTANRKSRYVSTKISVPEKQWNANKQRVSKSHEIAPALNRRLQTLLNEAREKALDASSAAAVKASVGASGGSLTAYFETFIGRLDSKGRFWEWKKYRVTLRKLRECIGQSIDWSELDRAALDRFEKCLRTKHKNNPATALKELGRVRRVFRQAVKDGVIRADQNPFLTYDMPKGSKPDRRKLSIEEVDRMAALDLSDGSPERLARDVFLVAFYAGGMRFGDVCTLKAEQVKEDRIEYRMLKTGSPVSIPIPEAARAILRPYLDREGAYVFPLLTDGDEGDSVRLRRRISSRNVVINRNLKTVAELAGIESDGLSMHVARHSFADYARQKSGNLFAISKALGHRDLATTQQYLKSFDREAVDNLAGELWQ